MKITKITNINNEFEVVIEFEFNGEILQAKNHEEIALQVFKEWANNKSLWSLGYSQYLKDSTYNTLLKWKSYVILSKIRS